LNRRLLVIPGVALALLAAIGVLAWHRQHKIEEEVIREADQAHTEEVKQEAQAEIPPLETRIGPGDNFPSALQKSGISAEDAAAISNVAQRAFNMRQIRAGNTIDTERQIAAINGKKITLAVPLSDSYDSKYLNPPGTKVVKVPTPTRLSQVGVEHLHIESPRQEVNH